MEAIASRLEAMAIRLQSCTHEIHSVLLFS